MTLRQFVAMWKKDNSVEDMLLMDKNPHDDVVDYLYHVLYRNGRGGNGRHEAVRVRVNKLKEVTEHNIYNLHGEDWGRKDAQLDLDNNGLGRNYSAQISQWFSSWSTATNGTSTAQFSVVQTSSTGAAVYNI